MLTGSEKLADEENYLVCKLWKLLVDEDPDDSSHQSIDSLHLQAILLAIIGVFSQKHISGSPSKLRNDDLKAFLLQQQSIEEDVELD